MLDMTPWGLAGLTAGLLLTAGGIATFTWLAVDTFATGRWRRRAEVAEERSARLAERLTTVEAAQLRAGRPQRPETRGPEMLPGLPGVTDQVLSQADRALEQEAPTVLMGALSPHAEQLYREMQRRQDGAR